MIKRAPVYIPLDEDGIESPITLTRPLICAFRVIASTLLLLLAMKCVAADVDVPPQDVIVELVENGGGDCPRYTLRLYADGRVKYEVVKVRQGIVTLESTISMDALNEIKNDFHQIKFLELRPIQYHPTSRRRLYDCRLDWDYLKRMPAYVEQCKTRDIVESSSSILVTRNSVGSLFFRDGAKARRISDDVVEINEIAAIRYRINKTLNSEQWVGANGCLIPPVSVDVGRLH